METFCCKTKIYAGAGALESLKELKAKRLFLVTDPFFAQSDWPQKIARLSQAEAVEIFSRVSPDPSVELAAEGTAALRSFDPDTVVALGGGSAMDCAKAMVYFSGLTLTFVAIPTTSGSGSEVTDFAILTHGNVKHPLVDPAICPQVAILDSQLLEKLPRSLVADCGFDVLSHALEAFVAKGAGSVTDALAKEAFGVAFATLPASYAGKLYVRQRLHEASTMAGMAFTQAGLGLCHALAHSLGGAFHIPHGRLNAILLPSVIGINAQVAAGKYAQLARSAGICASADTVAVRNLKNALIRLRRELGLPESLSQAGVDPRQLRQKTQSLVKSTLEDPCCDSNPLPVEDFMVRRVLEEVCGIG